MPEDGDAMHVYDHEHPEARRRPVDAPQADRDPAWQGAKRAAEAGHVRGVEHGAVLHLQRLAGNAGVGTLVGGEMEEQRSPVLDVVGKGGGTPLRSDTRVQMESHLGADLGDVRVHDGGAAADSARAVNAKAYTVGNEVVFGSGSYQPDTPEGQHTLAHELTHVVQQRSGPVDGTSTGDGIALSDPSDRFEREAEASASTLGRGDATPAAVSAAPATAQREADEEAPTQTLRDDASVQREGEEEEEAHAQMLREDAPVQREGEEEEEPVQAMHDEAPVQREGEEEEEPIQAMPEDAGVQREGEEEEQPA
jgi:Domain of unknown function (DUF4157)